MVTSDKIIAAVMARPVATRRQIAEQFRSTVKRSFSSRAIRWRSCDGPSHRPTAAERCTRSGGHVAGPGDELFSVVLAAGEFGGRGVGE